MTTTDDRAGQIERDFGSPHPCKTMYAAMRREDDREVTPLQRTVCRERICELGARGFEEEDGLIVLLMRGARIEALAEAVGEAIGETIANVKARCRQLPSLDEHVEEAMRTRRILA